MSIFIKLMVGHIKAVVTANTFVALLMICMMPSWAHAEAILKKDSITCLNKESLDEFLLAQGWKDQRGMDHLTNAKQCAIIGYEHVPVSILPAPAGTKAPYVRLRAYYPDGKEQEIWSYQQNIIEASSAIQDVLIEGARLCSTHFPEMEKKNSIPTHLLAAIATNASGRWYEKLGMKVPWPWTTTVNGQVHYFADKQEAVSNTKTFLSQSPDVSVGCMQVNLKQHPKAFSNLDDAFDPEKNTEYAASLLAEKFSELGDWPKATGAYHSDDPEEQKKYLKQIEESWNAIVEKVAESRAAKSAKSDNANPSAAGCHFKPNAIICADPDIAATVYKEYGFNTTLIRQSYTAKILFDEDCITASSYAPVNYGSYKKEWKPLKVEEVNHGKIAEPDGWFGVHFLKITMDHNPFNPDSVGHTFLYYVADGYIEGTCSKEKNSPPAPHTEAPSQPAPKFTFAN